MMPKKLDICMRENETKPLPHTIHKIHSKCIIDLNVGANTIKFLEESVSRALTSDKTIVS